MDILTQKEHVTIDRILAHGGLFKPPLVGQKICAAALNVPVSVMSTAGEGGAWSMAILASYMVNKEPHARLCRAMRGIRWPSKAITPEMPQHSWGYLKCVMKLFENTLRELIEPAAPYLTFMPADIEIPHVGNIHGIQAVMKVLTYPQQIVRRAARQP